MRTHFSSLRIRNDEMLNGEPLSIILGGCTAWSQTLSERGAGGFAPVAKMTYLPMRLSASMRPGASIEHNRVAGRLSVFPRAVAAASLVRGAPTESSRTIKARWQNALHKQYSGVTGSFGGVRS